jgi:hypothetical protein
MDVKSELKKECHDYIELNRTADDATQIIGLAVNFVIDKLALLTDEMNKLKKLIEK